MDTHQLRQFAVVARSESMTEAAHKLGVSQPSLSQSIKKLEGSLGVPLFTRDGRNLILNEYGKILLQQADIAFRSMDNAVKELHDLSDYGQRNIRFIARQPLGNLARMLETFHEQNPNIFASCLTPNESMYESEYDLELFASTAPQDEENTLHVCDEDYVLCVPRTHRLAKEPAVALRDLAGEKFVRSPARSEMNDVIQGMFDEAGFKPKESVNVSLYWDVLQFVEQGFGACIATDISWFIGMDTDLVTIPFSDIQRTRGIYLKWPHRAYLSESSLAFVNFLCTEIRTFSDRRKLGKLVGRHVR